MQYFLLMERVLLQEIFEKRTFCQVSFKNTLGKEFTCKLVKCLSELLKQTIFYSTQSCLILRMSRTRLPGALYDCLSVGNEKY